MHLRYILCYVALVALSLVGDSAPASQKKEIFPSTHVYRTIGDRNLHLYLYEIPKSATGAPRPAIVFFHGGGWQGGTPEQFVPHCKYLASRGMVAMTVEYRLLEKGAKTPLDCIADARSAIRWVRAHAKELGIDPNRIAAGGGSAGGHLAACTGLIDAFDDPRPKTPPSAPTRTLWSCSIPRSTPTG